MRLVTSTLVLALLAATAEAAPARSFDLVSYSVPLGDLPAGRAGEVVTISRVRDNTYCLVGIYASTPASASLEASFAAEWTAVILKRVGAGASTGSTVLRMTAAHSAAKLASRLPLAGVLA